MSIRVWAFSGGIVLAAAITGIATSQQAPPSPVAATAVALTPSRAEAAALAQARQSPVTARLRAGISQNKALEGLLPRIDASSVPVLGPADPGLMGTAAFHGRDRVYMLVVQRDAQIIEIYGTTKAFQSPLARASGRTAAAVARPGPRITAASPPAGAARALAQAGTQGLTNVRTERTEYGVDVSFSRFGAAYNVSFICEGAPDCTEAQAVAFAAGLQLIGGGA